jgi:hypothetical protein
MMKSSIVLLSAVLATAAFAALPIPSGTYAGKGTWKGAGGKSGEYTVETTVKDQVFVSRYSYTTEAGTRSETHTTKMILKDDPFFDVMDEKDQLVGKGTATIPNAHTTSTPGRSPSMKP